MRILLSTLLLCVCVAPACAAGDARSRGAPEVPYDPAASLPAAGDDGRVVPMQHAALVDAVTLSREGDVTAVDVRGEFPARALDPELQVGALRFATTGATESGAMRFPISAAAPVDQPVFIQYGQDVLSRRLVAASLEELR